MPVKDGGGKIEERVGPSARDKGGRGARGGIRACGGEKSVGGGEVLIAPAAMVSSRKFGEFAEPHFMEVGTGERLRGRIGGSVITNRRRE